MHVPILRCAGIPPVRLLPITLAALLVACGGEEESETAASPSRPAPAAESDTLPVSVPAPRYEEGVVIVDPEQVREWQETGREFVLIDARDAVQYGQEHLPGAINVPYVDIRAGGNLPPKSATIVLYCSDARCPISQYAYRSLEQLGYANLYDMRAGLQGWKAEGYPTVIEGGESS